MGADGRSCNITQQIKWGVLNFSAVYACREFWLGFDDEQMRASSSEFPQRFGTTQALHSHYQVWLRKQEIFILQYML
jgi:hypothetical protein